MSQSTGAAAGGQPPARKYEFIAAGAFDYAYKNPATWINNPPLRRVAEAFEDNMERVKFLALFPSLLAGWGAEHGWVLAEACVEVFGRLVDLRTLTGDEAHKVREVYAAADRIHNAPWTAPDGARVPFATREVIDLVELLAVESRQTGEISLGMIFSAQLTGTWTAFETLSGDLWEAALNAHPHSLAELKGKRSGAAAPLEPGDKAGRQEEGKQVPLRALQRYGYNLSGRMGTVLKERFNFSILDGIRAAYRSAFAVDFDAVDAALDDRSLDDLAAVRNVIVHRAGVADREFVKRKKQDARLAGIAEGERLAMDGLLVHALADSAVRCGVALLRAVDSWLSDHPSRLPTDV